MANTEPENNCENEKESTLVSNSLSSCLRDSSKTTRRNFNNRSVSFPENENQIVTGYLEPVNPWEYAEGTNKETVIASYIRSSEKHETKPIKRVIEQLESYDYDEVGNTRFELLDLKGEQLLFGDCEALEEVLKRLQFERIDLEDTGLDDEAAVALFDMIEYYEAAVRLNISNNGGIGVRGWQACSRMLKRTKCLEELECRSTPLSEQVVPILSRALRLGTQLQVLRMEASSLTGRSLVVLAAGLKLNTTLKELYLGENSLGPNDGLQLSALLKCNTTLQLLDLSNNGLEDTGLSHICDALCEQSRPAGLAALILWNNKLGPAAAHHLSRALKVNDTLEMLNVGHNEELGDRFLRGLEEALSENRTLFRLGVQSTGLTAEGALVLAGILHRNLSLQRIDLRDNNLEYEGVAALAEAMKHNTSITQLDIDERPKGKISEVMERYMEAVESAKSCCCRNEAGGDEALLRARLSMMAARKISLTCDTLRPPHNSPASVQPGSQPAQSPQPQQTFLQVGESKKGGRLRSPAPSPIPSPVASPSPTRTRFQVSRVNEESPPDSPPVFSFSPSRSRFKVTIVEPGQQQQYPPTAPVGGTPPRTRKLSSWVSPGLESKAASGLEKLLGLFQNPFRNPGPGGEAGDGTDSGATWPAGRPTHQAVDTGHSASLSHLAVTPPTG